MTIAYLGLGSNLGDRAANLSAAIEALDWGDTRILARSGIYETEPIGGPPGQPAFLNQVLSIQTTCSPRELWERCEAGEVALGRSREREERWGPRTIDIDVLLYGDAVVNDPDLVIPHPRMHERAFVLVPLLEIAPEMEIPGRGRAADLLDAIEDVHLVSRID